MPRAVRPAPPARDAIPAPSVVDLAPTHDPLVHEIEGLVYRLDAPPRRHGRKSVVTVRVAGETTGAPLVDRADLFSFRSRRSFAQLVADVFARDVGVVLGQLALVLDAAERAASSERRPTTVALTAERRRAAERLLDAHDLLDGLASAMDVLGYVGEDATKRLAYLVATSRLLARPLSSILMAPSGCGKSELLETLTRLLPEESVEFLSRLTPQALYYAGPDHLRHKVVIVDEHAGATEADYAIRTLQSKGLLRLAAPANGKTAEPITVHGPITLMSGTTSSDLNPENLSRCLELALDDSPAQTRRVQEAQANAWTGGRARTVDVQAWQDAQRLLADDLPAQVVIPFAPKLSFPARTTADRRGSSKLLGLVAAHALLHGRQRARDREGRIVATPTDYAAVHALVRPVLAQGLDGLSPRAARVYHWLVDLGAPADRRQVAEAMGWVYNTAKKALTELEAQELARVVEPGPPSRYRTIGRTVLGAGAELTPPAAL
jgi:energy-coupling factor transporter ATP-binding protein EcfA2